MPKQIIWKTEETKTGDVVPCLMWGRDGSYVTLGTAPVTADAEIDHAAGHWANLDRTQLNDLIRAARRARDQTFGRDE
jgi:hypothetical protein